MKATATLLVPLLLTLAASAVEYATLTAANAGTKLKAVNATDLVEVAGTNLNNDGNTYQLKLTFANSSVVTMTLRGKEGSQYADMKGNSFTGLTSVQLEAANNANVAVTLRITPADEIGAGAPGTVLVIPDTATGDLTLEVQSSNDMVNWNPFLTHQITGGADPQFYRMRVIRTVAPAP
jgi:hypothetical protein